MTDTFACSIEVDAPPETVFGYFIEPELLLTWIGDHAVLDAQPGGEFTLDIEGIPVRGQYLEVVSPERVVVSWGHAGSETLPPNSTEVRFTLTPAAGGGTLVAVEHCYLPSEHLPSHRLGWPMFLGRLRDRASAGLTVPRVVGRPPAPAEMTRTRSEYRLSPLVVRSGSSELVTRPVRDTDREGLAALMLDAYKGTIDDEGEDFDDALAAVDQCLDRLVDEHSFVVVEGDTVIAMAFVVIVSGVHYVDPIVVATERKRKGLGRDAVRLLLESLSAAGITEVGATITDGNTASERLFLGLGFVRRGPWS